MYALEFCNLVFAALTLTGTFHKIEPSKTPAPEWFKRGVTGLLGLTLTLDFIALSLTRF